MSPTTRPARRRSDSERNRTAIIAAAAATLRDTGELKMQTVAASAGLSRSTLYRHFPSHTALEQALRREAVRAVRRAVEDAAAKGAVLAALRGLVAGLVET